MPIAVTNAELWKDKAVAAAVKAEKMLWGKHNEEIQAWMYEAGFTLETMRKAHLGWQVRNSQRPAESWGVSGCEKVRMPEGIIIPVIHEKRLRKLVIFRMGHGHDGAYHVMEGSEARPLVLPGESETLLLIHREMDALLLHQELKQKHTVVAIGNLTPDEALPHLDDSKEILLICGSEPLPQWEAIASRTLRIDGEDFMARSRQKELDATIETIASELE